MQRFNYVLNGSGTNNKLADSVCKLPEMGFWIFRPEPSPHSFKKKKLKSVVDQT